MLSGKCYVIPAHSPQDATKQARDPSEESTDAHQITESAASEASREGRDKVASNL